MKKYKDQYEKMTTAPVGGLIVQLAIPTIITMLVTNLYNMADTYFVSKLGTSASGATGVVFGLMALLQACGFMYGQGSGAIISRKLGAKDIDSASEYATAGFIAAFLTGVTVLILGIVFLTPLMKLLGSTATILPYSRVYGRCILLAAPAMITSCVLNNILRYEGKAVFAMIGLTSGGFINIGLDAVFIMVLNTGIVGAGIATAISQYISFAILATVFLMGKTESKISLRFFVKKRSIYGDIVKAGLPSLIRQGLGSVSVMVLNNSAAIYGDAAIAALSIVSRVINFLFSVGLGVGQGFQPVTGFNFGASKFSRVKKGFFFTWLCATVMLGSFAILAYFNAAAVVAFFRDDVEVVRIGTVAMKAQCIALLFIPFSVSNNMLFQCTGKSLGASFLSSLRSGVCFIPAIIVMKAIFGLQGIELAQAIADILAALICIPFTLYYFRELPEDYDPKLTLKEQMKND